jgi:hypothetical protein
MLLSKGWPADFPLFTGYDADLRLSVQVATEQFASPRVADAVGESRAKRGGPHSAVVASGR